MPSTKNGWAGRIDWATPAGRLLGQFLAGPPQDRSFRITVFGSASLQLTVDERLMSAAVDVFAEDDDLTDFVAAAKLDATHGGFCIEPGFELSFRTSPRWRGRAVTVERANVSLTIPHPIDILLDKLNRPEEKDLTAFKRVIQITGHPDAEELKGELRAAVDLFRPAFDDESPNKYAENTRRLWRELFNADIDVRAEIIAPAMDLRRRGYLPPSQLQGRARRIAAYYVASDFGRAPQERESLSNRFAATFHKVLDLRVGVHLVDWPMAGKLGSIRPIVRAFALSCAERERVTL
jgi:hypothetical protein